MWRLILRFGWGSWNEECRSIFYRRYHAGIYLTVEETPGKHQSGWQVWAWVEPVLPSQCLSKVSYRNCKNNTSVIRSYSVRWRKVVTTWPEFKVSSQHSGRKTRSYIQYSPQVGVEPGPSYQFWSTVRTGRNLWRYQYDSLKIIEYIYSLYRHILVRQNIPARGNSNFVQIQHIYNFVHYNNSWSQLNVLTHLAEIGLPFKFILSHEQLTQTQRSCYHSVQRWAG